jgi:MYXO-CTERM domain-containing protein
VILTGNGGRDATQVGEIVIRGSGSLGSNDPKFGNNQLPTLGSPVPEASTDVMAGLGLMVLAGLVARSRKTR